jgi:hypothetical protein
MRKKAETNFDFMQNDQKGRSILLGRSMLRFSGLLNQVWGLEGFW